MNINKADTESRPAHPFSELQCSYTAPQHTRQTSFELTHLILSIPLKEGKNKCKVKLVPVSTRSFIIYGKDVTVTLHITGAAEDNIAWD